jgi:hypothetical protein
LANEIIVSILELILVLCIFPSVMFLLSLMNRRIYPDDKFVPRTLQNTTYMVKRCRTCHNLVIDSVPLNMNAREFPHMMLEDDKAFCCMRHADKIREIKV